MAVHIGNDSMSYSIVDEKPSDLNQSDTFDVTDDHEEDSIHSNLSDSGTEDDDSVFRFDQKSSSYGSARRFFNKSSSKTWKGNKRSICSEDTSKEYLTLQFYGEDKAMSDTERVPVKKGKSLKESIECLLHGRGIDFSTHSVFLESSKTPLPLAFDTFPLGGNVLYVKENHSMQVDERIITLMKSGDDDKKIQNQRARKNLMSSIFNDEVEASPISNKPQSVTRKSGVAVGYNKDESRTLSDLLNYYTLNHFNSANETDGYKNSSDDMYLEDSWTNVITEYEGMTSKDRIQQETIWELLVTERNYLRKLSVIIMVFKNCLINLQKENYLEEIDINKLFANIKEVYDTNHAFWENHLKHVTEEARASKRPIKPSQLHESFSSFEELFQPYIRYCMEEGSCVKYLKQQKRENETFQEYLAWCENHRQCMRLELADLFVKPMQRVTKYALLLKAILSKTSDEDEKIALESMIFKVDRFVTKINTTLRLRNEQQKLDDVLERIEAYVPIEAANEEMEKLLEGRYCNFDLHGNIPGLPEEEQRCILLEGPMKMIEKQGRGDVHVFLFTDVLVLTKAKKGSDKFRIIRQPYRLNKIILERGKDIGTFVFVYLNEYGVMVTAFTLQVSLNEQTKWINAIEKAKTRYENARAAKGSTLAFFDDDLTASTTALVTSIGSTVSPTAERRSIVNEDCNLDTSFVIKNDLRYRSTETVTQLHRKPEEVTSESHVKRSFSDPKAGISYPVHERSSSKQQARPRPKSLVNISDHDIATWVLTNENRNQSGSITSDISDDSQRSSGIGDSFRSINSDGGITFMNLPEVSKVAQLKARFENQGCNSPVTTEESDSSLPTPLLGFSESLPTLTCCRRISPQDYMDEHLTIREEEEQCTNNMKKMTMGSSITDSDKDTENESSESLQTINDVESTLGLSNYSGKDTNLVNNPLDLSYTGIASQTDIDFSVHDNDSVCNTEESSIQCNLYLLSLSTEGVGNDLEIMSPIEQMYSQNLASFVSGNSLPLEVLEDSTQVKSTQVNFARVDISENLGSCNIENLTMVDTSESLMTDEVDKDMMPLCISERLHSLEVNKVQIGHATDKSVEKEVCQSPCTIFKSSSRSGSVSEFLKSNFSDASTQCDEELMKNDFKLNECSIAEMKSFSDCSTQCETICYRDTSTQCGDFIQLTGASDKDDIADKDSRDPMHKSIEDRNSNVNSKFLHKPPLRSSSVDDASNVRSISPFMDMLLQPNRPYSVQPQRRPGCILKHSYSEANISTATAISHNRSRSDEPQQSSLPNSPEHKHRNSAPTTEFPGMRALQTLSESLESSLQYRLEIPSNSKPIIKHYDDDINITSNTNRNNTNNSSRPILVRQNSSSTSLRKLAIMNNSPCIRKKEFDEKDAESLETDLFNEDMLHGPMGQSSPKLRSRIQFSNSGDTMESNRKRFTWHDFDSQTALQRIEQTKYGPSGRTSTYPLTKSLSKSTEIISSRKKSSLKRSIIKRLTGVINRSDESKSDESRSSDNPSNSKDIDEKSLKKIQKEEKKKLKKEKRIREKEEKKRDGDTKFRSASLSSGNSRNSIPLSTTNSHGSCGSHTSSINSR